MSLIKLREEHEALKEQVRENKGPDERRYLIELYIKLNRNKTNLIIF